MKLKVSINTQKDAADLMSEQSKDGVNSIPRLFQKENNEQTKEVGVFA